MCIDEFFNASECAFVSVDDYVDVTECKKCVNVYVQSALCDHMDKCARDCVYC